MENKYYTDPEKIGKFIKLLRENHNLTQDELGKKLFITRKAVSKWETGRSLPSIEMMHDIANILGVSFNEIVEGEFQTPEEVKPITKAKKLVKRIFMFVLFISLIALLIFFCDNHNATKIYKVEYIDENFVITEGNLIITSDSLNFKLGNFTCYKTDISDNQKYDFMLYIKNDKNEIKEIVKFDSADFTFNEKENNRLNIKNIKENIDKLYLKVSYKNTNEENLNYDLHLFAEVNEENETEAAHNNVKTNNLKTRSSDNNSDNSIDDSNDDIVEIDLSFLYNLSEKELKDRLNNILITIENENYEIIIHDKKNINILNNSWKITLDLNLKIIYVKIYINQDIETYYLNIVDNKIKLHKIPEDYYSKMNQIIDKIKKKCY